MIDILIPAFLISLVLLGIHSYFGIRIIERGIIFTDLAIGQMAAFGAAICLLFFNGEYVYPVSLAFALMGGFMIAVATRRSRYLESVIGLIYALGLSGVFILLSKSPHGMEDFNRLMAYDIIFTQLSEVWPVALLYGVIGLVIYMVNRHTKGFLNELLFFVTFAATVTSSVKMAGVLVIFAILLAPALTAIHISKREGAHDFFKKYTLATAWIIGVIINMAAIVLSYLGDFPTGHSIVFCNALVAVIVSFAVGLPEETSCED